MRSGGAGIKSTFQSSNFLPVSAHLLCDLPKKGDEWCMFLPFPESLTYRIDDFSLCSANNKTRSGFHKICSTIVMGVTQNASKGRHVLRTKKKKGYKIMAVLPKPGPL